MKYLKKFPRFMFFLLCLHSGLQAQYTIKGTIKGIIAKKVYLSPNFGFDSRPVDSALVSDYSFMFTLSPKTKTGLYRLNIGKDLKGEFYNEDSKYIDLILNNENIEFSSDISAPIDSIKVASSEENRLYYEFLNKNHKLNVKLGILDQLPDFFPPGDEFYSSVTKEYKRVQKLSAEIYDGVFQKNMNTIAAHICRSEQIPMMDIDWSGEYKYMFARNHFFDNVDFKDTVLLKTDVFSSKIISYIKMMTSKQLSQKEQEHEYMKAIDTILAKARPNDRVYRFSLDYLVMGFEQIELDEVLVYIHDKYLSDNSCSDDHTTSNLNKRIEGYKKLTIGSPAPPISITDDNGKVTNLADIAADYTLILFYASWCPHCVQMLPEIRDIYDNIKKKNPNSLEIMAISLDTLKSDWLNFLTKGRYEWINYCDFKRWDSKIVQDYYVYATPTMIIVDRKKIIHGKPITIQQLKSFLQSKGLI